MPIYSNFYQTLTTACPIVELRGYAAACGLKGHLYAYLDFNGPTGTARDGLAEGMLALAIEKKQLAPGQPIIEAASGPFATALTLASLTAGHPIVLVMPEDAPALRQEYLLRLGAQIRHSPARSGLAGARALAAQTAAANGWYYMNWLANDDNPEYHRRVTGPAIVQSIARQNKSLVDAITIGVGSAGTVTGVGETVKAWTNDVRIVAVEPYENQVLGGGLTGPHGIPDIGYGIIRFCCGQPGRPAGCPAGAAHRCHPRFGQRRCCPARRRPAAGQLQQPRGTGHFQRTCQHRVSGCFYQ